MTHSFPTRRSSDLGKTFQFLAMAKPVIVGKINEPAGFKDKSNCILVNQGNGKEIAQAIQWCYENREILKDIGAEAKKLYDDKFGFKSRQDRKSTRLNSSH